METSAEQNQSKKIDKKRLTNLDKHEEIKTDFPLSEKDEIKQAEERLRKAVKRNS